MNKKAADESTMKNAIFALIILIILLSIFTGVLHTLPDVGEAIQCESHVKLASRLKNPATKQTRLDLSNSCPTKDITISPKGDGEENALDDILNEMYFCANKFGLIDGEVKYNPFSQWKTDNACVVCSNIKFDSSFAGKELNGLLSRSAEANIPTKEEKSFLEYFSGFKPTTEKKSELVELEKQEQFIIDTNEEYYVVYSVDMSTSKEGFLKSLAYGTIAGAGAGTVGRLSLSSFISFFTLGKLRTAKYILWGFTAAGAAGGAYTGANVKDQSDANLMGESTLLLISKNPNDPDQPKLSDFCKTLGTDPLEDPWGDEIQ